VPNFAAKYSSEFLSAERLRSALLQLPSIIEHLLGQVAISARYGCGTKLHAELHFIPMGLSTELLPFFLEDSLDQRIYAPGESDLLLALPDQQLDLIFCHESDIHINGEDEELMRQFIGCAQYQDIKFYSQAELKALYPDRRW